MVRGRITNIGLHTQCLLHMYCQQSDTKLHLNKCTVLLPQIVWSVISHELEEMHECAGWGWLHEAVHTSCLHTNQHWCLLSAFISVNTDVYVRKRSDRCMIEVLKCRHSQQPFLLWISQGCCVFHLDNICFSTLSSTETISLSFNWCKTPYPRLGANCAII